MSQQRVELSGEHEHKWQGNGLTRVQAVSHSPCSRYDDILYTKVFSVMVCECGEVKKVHVSNENKRRRGDDIRRGKVNTVV